MQGGCTMYDAGHVHYGMRVQFLPASQLQRRAAAQPPPPSPPAARAAHASTCAAWSLWSRSKDSALQPCSLAVHRLKVALGQGGAGVQQRVASRAPAPHHRQLHAPAGWRGRIRGSGRQVWGTGRAGALLQLQLARRVKLSGRLGGSSSEAKQGQPAGPPPTYWSESRHSASRACSKARSHSPRWLPSVK